jgi:hypothetical protein
VIENADVENAIASAMGIVLESAERVEAVS